MMEFSKEFPALTNLETIRTSEIGARLPTALAVGDWDLMDWMIESGHCSTDAQEAAKAGNLQLLEMIQKNTYMDGFTAAFAIQGGHVNCLRLIMETVKDGHKFHKDPGLAELTAHVGTVECLEYLHRKQGYKLCVALTVQAAANGHLACLRYAHENGCVWDPNVTAVAAMGNHIDCLRYAHGRGCRLCGNIKWLAMRHGSLDCLWYLHHTVPAWQEGSRAVRPR
jgi:hypothetical protein